MGRSLWRPEWPDSLRPDDRWLSIAETFEFLPDEDGQLRALSSAIPYRGTEQVEVPSKHEGAMDTELVVRAQHGDGAAFEELARESVARLHDVARSILSDGRLAEDATQQALLDIWRDLPRLREPDRFEAWSYRLLVHACYDEARRQRRWMPNLSSVWTAEPLARDDMAVVVDREQLERGFRDLSVEQRAVVVLHHYRGLPLEQVADVLGIRVGTAHSRLHRAMQGLRAALEADDRPPARQPDNHEVVR